MTGAIEQISISKGGVPKYAILQAEAGPLGLAGDVQKHPEIHGGPRQALLWITSEGLAELRALGYNLQPGSLGENITTSGIDRRSLRVGQRWRLGEIEVEITKRRAPCKQLLHYGEDIHKALFDERVKANDPTSPLWGLSGVYCAVIRSGTIRPGDPVLLLTTEA
jgi:MOSC domain-containing protein YiiM